jgi:hypothetical protein
VLRVLHAWSHPGRIHSEAAFAALAGISPLPASSGNTRRHRLNRGGDRRLNRALCTVAQGALLAARVAGYTHVPLDGTLIRTDRCKAGRPDREGRPVVLTAGPHLGQRWRGHRPRPGSGVAPPPTPSTRPAPAADGWNPVSAD